MNVKQSEKPNGQLIHTPMPMTNQKPSGMCKGIVLISWSTQEINDHNRYYFEDGRHLLMANDWTPNNYSLEIARVELVHHKNTFIKEGDTAIVDYAIFTLGRNPKLQGTTESRFVLYEQSTDKHYYWCNETEVYGTLEPDGTLRANKGVFILEPVGEPKEKKAGSIIIPSYQQDREKPFLAKVIAVGERDGEYLNGPPVQPGDEIWCEGGLSSYIRFKGKEYEHIHIEYVLAVRPHTATN